MNKRRLLIVSRRFWPLSGEIEILAGSLATQLSRAGHDVTVVSAGLVKQWPQEFRIDRTRVRRISLANRRLWTGGPKLSKASRWIRGLQRWLQNKKGEIDGVIALEFPADRFEVSQLLAKTPIPAVVRIDPKSLRTIRPDRLPPVVDSVGVRNGFQIVLPRECDRRLATQAFPEERTRVVPDGISQSVHCPGKEQMRKTLADAHQILSLSVGQPLAISTAPMTKQSGLLQLVRAWRNVLIERPNAKLWLLGSGESQEAIFQRISDLDLTTSILLPGEFDDIRDVLEAADLYIMPGKEDDLSIFEFEAIQLDLPIACFVNSPAGARLAAEPIAFEFDNYGSTLSKTILHVLDRERQNDSQHAEKYSGAIEIPSIETMADEYLEMITQTIGDCVVAVRST